MSNQIRTIEIVNGSQFATPAMQALFGPVRQAEKSERVIREDVLVPTPLAVWGGEITAMPGQDYIAYPIGFTPDGEVVVSTKGRPVSKGVWDNQYEMAETMGDMQLWKAKGIKRVVQVPEGVLVILITIDSRPEDPDKRQVQVVEAGDFVAIGASNEVYANSKSFVTKNLVPVDDLGSLV